MLDITRKIWRPSRKGYLRYKTIWTSATNVSFEAQVKDFLFKTTEKGCFLWIGFDCLKAAEALRGDSLLVTTKFQKYLALIWYTSQGWKAESILEPPSGFEHGSPGLGILGLNHKTISQKSSVLFSRYSSFYIFNRLMIFQTCDVMMSISTWNRVNFWIYIFWTTTHQVGQLIDISKNNNFQESFE